MILAFIVNTCYLIFVWQKEYASDVEWFRVRVFSGVMIFSQFVAGVLTTYWLIQILQKKLAQDEEDARLLLESQALNSEALLTEITEDIGIIVDDTL